MNTPRTVKVELTLREVVLIRCGLLRRMDALQGRDDASSVRSYEDSRELMARLWEHVRNATPEEVS